MAITKETPFEYHEKKLGVKIKFLIHDRDYHESSLQLISYKALNQRMKSDTQSERQLRRASFGFDALVEFDSLNQEWRDQLTVTFGKPKEEVKESFFAKHYLSDRAAFDFFASHRYGEDGNRKLEPDVIELYTYNASVLNAILEVRSKRKIYARSLGITGQFDIWQSLSNDVNAFQGVKHDLPTKKDSLRHKVNRYIKEGYQSIISGKYGLRNAASVVTPEQYAIIEELLSKHQNLNNEQIVDIYNIIAVSKSFKTIGAGVVAKIRKDVDMYVFTGKRGITELMHQKHMQVKRSKPSASMLFWTMDGWDAELLYQKTTINSSGNSVTTYHNRLTVVMVLDPYNDYIIGYAIGPSESPSLIRSALKNAINHTEELFGNKYKPYQLQTDNYQIANLRPTYESTARHFTPAKVKNSKAKPIEQFFDKFNEKYFQAKLVSNWSGHNVTANKENQVNSDYLNKIRHQFPDEQGCRAQLINAIELDRSEKLTQYVDSFKELDSTAKIEMTINQYLRTYGQTTGYTNKLRGDGLTPTINGRELAYDTFDLSFRQHMHEDWMVFYDEDDTSKILVSNAKSSNGKLVEEIGKLEFVLEEKYIQPMALYDQEQQDVNERQKVFDFNKNLNNQVLQRNTDRSQILDDFFDSNPQLDTLRKLMISDSNGQHKDQKSAERIENAAKKLTSKQEKVEKKIIDVEWKSEQDEYLKNKVNLNKYANI